MRRNCFTAMFCVGVFALAAEPVAAQAVTNQVPSGTNQGYVVENLISDVATNAASSDSRLINPWGLVVGPGVDWMADNGTGLITVDGVSGLPFNFAVTVPGPADFGRGRPTGLIFNNLGQFAVSNGARSGPSTFIAATEQGTIVGWDYYVSGPYALIAVDNSRVGAVYTGLAIARLTNGAPMLYAANFRAGRVDMFNGSFQFDGSFTDPNLPAGYAPFNIKTVGGKLFVAFAIQDSNARGAVAGPGNGLIDVFNPDGTLFMRRFAAGRPLNAPWGMAMSPWDFGPFSHALLVGNFGDGRINAYDVTTGRLLGHLTQTDGSDVVIDHLWGLGFESELANAGSYSSGNGRLFFTAGPNGGAGGLFGYIQFNGPLWPPALFLR